MSDVPLIAVVMAGGTGAVFGLYLGNSTQNNFYNFLERIPYYRQPCFGCRHLHVKIH
ncbi:Uncharacterised protein [Salmonella enterica subsp. arizonae]|uniref:Uncharacterized protein n=1 Tax=Salmonella enterica subsp. arizonae TaxID=59203 RepID=A0A447R2D4_SALER|nr:Uncharacterised protein [Salmonella enterica subsp. arizonae]